MIVLVGATGFVGKNLSKVFDSNNVNYVGFDSKEFNLLDYESIKKNLEKVKPRYIINCAAVVGSLHYVSEHCADIIDINIKMILNLYKVVKEISPDTIIINPIANCAYPGNITIYKEEDFYNGPIHESVKSYGTTRRFLVTLSEVYSMQHQITSINLLVPNMYGPFDSTDPNKAHALNALVSKIVKAKNNKEDEFVVWGSGVVIREWLFAEDFGKAVLQIITGKVKHGLSEPINIAQNFGLSIKELVNIILEKSNSKIAIKWDTSMPDGAPKKVMDDNNFKKVFKDFIFKDFNDGINETIKYYEKQLPY